MKLYSQLEVASFENLASDPSLLPLGRFWQNTTSDRPKIKISAGIKQFMFSDDPLIVGTNGTAANNVRLHRGGTALAQFVPANNATAEGTLATSLAQYSGRIENWTSGTKPAAGNAGRIAYISDLNRLEFDNGSVWNQVGGGALAVSSQLTLTSAAAIQFSGTTPRRLVKIQSNAGEQDLSALSPQIQAGVDEGQELLLVGQSDTDYVVLKSGNGLRLKGEWLSTANQVLSLVWLNSLWVEISRS